MNIINSIKSQNRMNTIFMNSRNNPIFQIKPNLSDKIGLIDRSNKYVAIQGKV